MHLTHQQIQSVVANAGIGPLTHFFYATTINKTANSGAVTIGKPQN